MQTSMAFYTPTLNCTVSALSPGNNYGNTVFLSEASPSNGYIGASGGWNASLAARSGPLQKESSGSGYVEFSITPAPGFRFILKTISLGMRSTQTGPRHWAFFQEEDQFSLSLAQGQIANNSTWSLVETNQINYSASKKVIFRIYGFDGEGTPAINVANWRLDDLMLQLQVMPDNLPVKWVYQRVENIAGKVMVEWATEQEVEVESFLIQRSVDAIHFESVAQISPQSLLGFSSAQHFYKYVDEEPLPGQSFYRILQRDILGATEASNVFIVQRPQVQRKLMNGQLTYVLSSGTLKIPFNYNGPADLRLINMNGQLVSHYRLSVVGGVCKFVLPQWLHGYYVLLLTTSRGPNQEQYFSTSIYIN